MKASVVDLRYRMNDILKAIDRNEEVTILYHGKVKGVIKPKIHRGPRRTSRRISEHPFFNMHPSKVAAYKVMTDLRGDRYRAI
jgi:antitoxin (DNA-binding transcriptional repressor) of toxin-antitoxin stability system